MHRVILGGFCEVPTTAGFGGTKRNRLFMAGSSSIYAIYVNAIGAALS